MADTETVERPLSELDVLLASPAILAILKTAGKTPAEIRAMLRAVAEQREANQKTSEETP